MENSNLKPIFEIDNGSLNPKVELKPDFFTGFQPEHRKEITDKEAAFYHGITAPYSVDDKIEKKYIQVKARDGYEISVKTYTSKKDAEHLPCVVFIHGGGFITCTPETHDYVPSYISANANAKVFNVDYRLAPEYKFPVGLEDCYDVLKWVEESADELEIDQKNIAVAGDSSGGNFAAALTLMARDRQTVHISKQILIYPLTDCSGSVVTSSASYYGAVGGDAMDIFEMYFKDKKKNANNIYASPMLAESHQDLPAALFIEAQCDSLRDDGLIYANILKSSGVEVNAYVYNGMPHAFILRTYSETFDALNKIVDFVK